MSHCFFSPTSISEKLHRFLCCNFPTNPNFLECLCLPVSSILLSPFFKAFRDQLDYTSAKLKKCVPCTSGVLSCLAVSLCTYGLTIRILDSKFLKGKFITIIMYISSSSSTYVYIQLKQLDKLKINNLSPSLYLYISLIP